MEIKFNKCKYNIDREGFWLALQIEDVSQAQQFIENKKDKEYIADLKIYRSKRSLDANAYMWVLLQKMAEVLRTTKDELYLQELRKYGQFTHVIVRPDVVDKVKQEWRVAEEVGEVEVNGQKGIQIRCYFGSSTYNTEEMAVLIDGVISDCKILGVETLPEQELVDIKERWGK